jgi:hypothetical protein
MKGTRKMNRQKLTQQVMWTILITLLVVGCGAPAATPTPIPPTGTPTTTSEPLPETVAEAIEVTYDGNECTVSGPTELPIGELSFVLKDLSEEMNVHLTVTRLLDGKTFQDLLDLQGEPGKFPPQRPSWIDTPTLLGRTWNESIGGVVYTYSLNKEGEYVILVSGSSPISVWYCAPLWVIEAPSE